jgi:hypothetical protein
MADVFHAAVAGAAPTDLRLYDTHWRERFYGHPDRYPRAVRGELTAARGAKLDRPLLLIHGLADDNVFPANMLRLSAALLAAGRPHEILPLTGATHRVSDETAAENLLWHEVRGGCCGCCHRCCQRFLTGRGRSASFMAGSVLNLSGKLTYRRLVGVLAGWHGGRL